MNTNRSLVWLCILGVGIASLDARDIPAMRGDAVLVLVEIAVDDSAALKAEGRDPVPVLMRVAASETDPGVLKRLADATMDLKMEPDGAMEVLRKLQTSSRLNEDTRKAVAYYIKKLTRANANTATSDTKE